MELSGEKGPYWVKGVVAMMQQKCIKQGKTLTTMIKDYKNLSEMKQYATYIATNLQQMEGCRHE
jgi:hypothetical protein